MICLKPQIKRLISIAFLASLIFISSADHHLVDTNNDVINVEDVKDAGNKVKKGIKDVHQHFFNKFSESDLKEFLEDHDIPTYTGKSSHTDAESLREYCSEKWHELVSPEGYENTDYSSWFAHLKDAILPSHKSKPEQILDEIKDKVSSAAAKVTGNDDSDHDRIDSKDISNWLFDSWDVPTLKSFLKENKVYISQDLKSKDELIQICKDHFNQLSDYLGSSGYYISDKYFSKWTKADLEKWLKKNKIQYKANSKLNDLKKLVRENIYKVTNHLQQTKYELLDNLDLESFGGSLLSTKESVDDKINVLKENLSKPDLLKWLKLHDIDLKNFDINNDKDFYENFKKENYIDYLTKDLATYLDHKKEEAAKAGDSILSKSSKQIESQLENAKDIYNTAVDMSNDKLDDLSSWSLETLHDFEAKLNKELGYHRKKLHKNKKETIKYIENVKENQQDKFNDFYKTFTKDTLPGLKDAVVQKTDYLTSFFDNWSLENLQKWVSDGVSVNDDHDSLIEKAKKKLNMERKNKKNFQKLWDNTFNSWSKDDLLEYLNNLKNKNLLKSNSFSTDSDSFSQMSKEDLYQLCKDNTLWLVTGGKHRREKDKSYFEKVKDGAIGLKKKIPYLANI